MGGGCDGIKVCRHCIVLGFNKAEMCRQCDKLSSGDTAVTEAAVLALVLSLW